MNFLQKMKARVAAAAAAVVQKVHGGQHQVKQDTDPAGPISVGSLSRADKIYLYQASLMVPNIHNEVLNGSAVDIKAVINAVGSGSDGIDPSDVQKDVSSQVTPNVKAAIDAAVAASPNRHGTAVGHPPRA